MFDLHPRPDQLAAFRLGKLDDRELAEIERHVAECNSCCGNLKALPDDSFVGLVRRSAAPVDSGHSAVTRVGQGAGTRTWAGADTLTDPSVEVPAGLRDHPRYQILEKLGHGGMGVVFKARHRLMERVVALKILNPILLSHPASVERFQREVKAAARLVHPNIVTAYDADHAGESHFLVMECVTGVSLARLVEQRGALPVDQACAFVRQAALGLEHAFACGMVHRDIKPQNLMVTDDGCVKILDFGLARFASESDVSSPHPTSLPAGRLTQTSTMMGTPEYIAPEQAQAAHAADIRADIYSLGCTLYHLLAGHAPFTHGSALDKVKAHQEQAARPLTEVRPDVPGALAQIVARMMAKDPAKRYQAPAEVAAALAPFLPAQNAASPPRRRRRVAVVLSAAALAAVAVVAAYGFLPPVQEFAQTLIRVATNKGVLEIEADDDDVEITIKQSGKDVATAVVIEKKTQRSFELTAEGGKIFARLPGSDLRLKTTDFTVERGGKTTLKARALLADKPPALSDDELIQGKWIAVSGETDGKPLSEADLKSVAITFKADKAHVVMPGGKHDWGIFALDSRKQPRQIVVQAPGAKEWYRGIYRLEGDRLTLCMGKTGFPSEFKTAAKAPWVLMEFKRAGSGTLSIKNAHPTAQLEITVVDTVDATQWLWHQLPQVLDPKVDPGKGPGADLQLPDVFRATLAPGQTWKQSLPEGQYEVDVKSKPPDAVAPTVQRAWLEKGKDTLLTFGGSAEEDAQKKLRIMKKIASAMHAYHDAHGSFPTPASYDAKGNPLLSWRVHLLPFMDRMDLYQQFKLDEPWDSPHNSQLIAKIPAVYGMGATDGKTRVVVPVGKETIFPGGAGIKWTDFKNGTSNTVLVLEASPEFRVIWTKPDDWPVNPYQPNQGLGPVFAVARADGACFYLSSKLPAPMLRNIFSRTSGEAAPLDIWMSGEPPRTMDFGPFKHARADEVADAVSKWHSESKWNRPDIILTIVPNDPQKTLKVTCSEVLAAEIKKLVEQLEKAAASSADDLTKLQGQWTLILGEVDGKPLPADKIPKLEIRFQGSDFEIFIPGPPEDRRLKGTFTIDPAKKQIHLRFADVKGGEDGSYSWDGDRLALQMQVQALGPDGNKVRLTFERVPPGK
jgi:uncharacterized protein (TIGR03067 family)